MREDEITAWFAQQRNLNKNIFPIGIGDDMAEIAPRGNVLITTDILLENSHFDLTHATLEQVGYKAMAVNLSDCAAMASKPLAAVVSVGLPEYWSAQQLKELHAGITLAGDMFDCALVGGDITSWVGRAGLVINVAMLSTPNKKGTITRNGAKPGDIICVTGSLGGSLKQKHLTFTPRVKEALELVAITRINSMMDISDGLSTDLNRICTASKVAAIINEKNIPISDQAKNSTDPLDSALNDGEDFELLFTLPERNFKKLMKKWNRTTEITPVGCIIEGSGVQLRKNDGTLQNLQSQGFDHLK